MNNFWTLVKYEYKKIFMKKMTVISCLLGLTLLILSTFAIVIGNEYENGEIVGSKYDSMLIDRENARNLSGRIIDYKLILQASDAYSYIPKYVEGQYSSTVQYKENARAYSEIYRISRSVFNSEIAEHFSYKNMQELTEKQAKEFYNFREHKVTASINKLPVSEEIKAFLLESDKSIPKPFVYSYYEGYDRFFSILNTGGLICIFLISIFLSPLFCGEYSGCDQIILSSKNGKNSLIKAKIFTGFSLSIIIGLIAIFVLYISCMMIYGFDGASAAIQIKLPLSSLNLSMGQAAILFSLCVLWACVVIGAISMILSSKSKSPFFVIIIMTIVIIAPMIVTVPKEYSILTRIELLLPSNMIGFWSFISPLYFKIFNWILTPYQFMYLISPIISIILIPFIYRNFKKHQVN